MKLKITKHFGLWYVFKETAPYLPDTECYELISGGYETRKEAQAEKDRLIRRNINKQIGW